MGTRVGASIIKMDRKEQGSVLIVVLLFSSLVAVLALFSVEFAILQNKMATNYSAEVLERIKAQVSLDRRQHDLFQNYVRYEAESRSGIEFIQYVPDSPILSESSGTEYYRIYSDPGLKLQLQATIAIRRTKNGAIQKITRKTWEEVRD